METGQIVAWVGAILAVIGFVLIFLAFNGVKKSDAYDGQRPLLIHPWLLAYGLMLFVLSAVIDLAYFAMTR